MNAHTYANTQTEALSGIHTTLPDYPPFCQKTEELMLPAILAGCLAAQHHTAASNTASESHMPAGVLLPALSAGAAPCAAAWSTWSATCLSCHTSHTLLFAPPCLLPSNNQSAIPGATAACAWNLHTTTTTAAAAAAEQLQPGRLSVDAYIGSRHEKHMYVYACATCGGNVYLTYS